MKHEPKIHIIIAVILFIYSLILDIIGIILVIFLLDDFFILDFLGLITRFYFGLKGVKGTYDTFATLGEALPYVGALPLKTIGVFLVILEDRNPNSRIVGWANNTIGKLSVSKNVKKMVAKPTKAVGKK